MKNIWFSETVLKQKVKLENSSLIELITSFLQYTSSYFICLPACMQSMWSKMFLMVVAQSMCPKGIPSMALARLKCCANEPCWCRRANSKSNPCLKWVQTKVIGKIRSKLSVAGSKSPIHRLPRNPLSCVKWKIQWIRFIIKITVGPTNWLVFYISTTEQQVGKRSENFY